MKIAERKFNILKKLFDINKLTSNIGKSIVPGN